VVSKEDVMKVLKECYDPEIGISLVDLGLIYDVKVDKDKVRIKMTLTTPGCPMHSMMAEDVKEKVSKIKGVKSVNIDLVFDPPWTPDKMSEEAKKMLGFK
jgi:FeS assembly SUF system protein